MRQFLVLAVLCLAGSPVFGQTCAPSIPDPVPVDASRVSWAATTKNTNNSDVQPPVTYTVYEFGARRCTTQVLAVGFAGLPVGQHVWTVSASTPSLGEGEQSARAVKWTTAPSTPPTPTPTPSPPSALTVTSTRIDAAEWTCRDSAGAVLSSNTRQDKAQESCTNLALKNPGKVYEMRPSGYRIQAQ
jgi:hypothetical protein